MVLNRHLCDDDLELYAFGRLPEDAIPAFEQHLLICASCQDRMAETDADVQAMQAAAREIRLEAEAQSKTMRHGSGRGS